jgi:hypothetical protein
MVPDILEPRIDLLCKEYVLVQAWKKTSSYIRYHNWFSDTIELDRISVNLPGFISRLADLLGRPDAWENDPLRIVPAPKSQRWRVTSDTSDDNSWAPVGKDKGADACEHDVKLRPLAHVSIKDQVAATAIMLCLANQVETLQGDPRRDSSDGAQRKSVISYGNRLFCHAQEGSLYHHWGSVKLYRSYYQDYREFLSRPQVVASNLTESQRVVIVHSDLRQFYDRVRPEMLGEKIASLAAPGHDSSFYDLTRRLFRWEWARKDRQIVGEYARKSGLSDFSAIALPQGLVASGFFANVALLDFDDALRSSMSAEIEPGLVLEDACRYVDDLRIVLSVNRAMSMQDIGGIVTSWLGGLLDQYASGLEPSADKTVAAEYKGDARPVVRQSRKMVRIQSAISGGFDAAGGQEILDAVQGLMRSQQRYSKERIEETGWSLSPVPDVRDATVARFAAGRFRSTYRSLRPLLQDSSSGRSDDREDSDEDSVKNRVVRNQAELDDEARAFALGLIENWVEDPSNVRLLRIGLDLWPTKDVLSRILDLLRPFTEKGRRGKARLVAWYCLSEIFRAGATETGIVGEGESLPEGVDIEAYRSLLREEAIRLSSSTATNLPWYLVQQALLFLAATVMPEHSDGKSRHVAETRQYYELIDFFGGRIRKVSDESFATLSILARRSFLGQEKSLRLVLRRITIRRLEQIAQRDPAFALEIIDRRPSLAANLSSRLKEDLCLRIEEREDWESLVDVVLQGGPEGRLRNELTILSFADKFLKALASIPDAMVVTPSQVSLRFTTTEGRIPEVAEVEITPSQAKPDASLYQSPSWCSADEHWRFQLGYVLRFILTARRDFTRSVRLPHWKEGHAVYRAAEGHWYQRLYALFNGHSAFGDDWLPISDWIEGMLLSLLSWPGCAVKKEGFSDIEEAQKSIEGRILELRRSLGAASGALILPLVASWPMPSPADRPLRACVVQTVMPTVDQFDPLDLSLSRAEVRRQHRNHLSAALAAIDRMLYLRETHREREGRLDLLILPELAVHPLDVKTHLVPFARAHKSIILAGLTYEELFAGQPLVNSALWVIPEWSSEHGLQIVTRRQGKQHLAPIERSLNLGVETIRGFRPCQWLVGYRWSHLSENPPLWMTAAICYDATDLRLASDLRHRSDVFIIPALNKDVHTFDQMAMALHYHMFQFVVIVNNGAYGGSNAYAPYKEAHVRQVFHMHGQPQASISFLEIEDISMFLRRKVDAQLSTASTTGAIGSSWKFPPAGL